MAKIDWHDYIPDFVSPIKLAHKSNGYAYYHDDADNTLKIPLADVPEFEAKLRAKRKDRGILLPMLMLALLAGALLVLGLSCGG